MEWFMDFAKPDILQSSCCRIFFLKVFEYQKWLDGGYVIIFRIASNWNLHVTLFLGKNVHHIIL